jgi:hypothetical protein
MKIPILMSVDSSSSSEFVRTRHWLSSITGPYVFLNIFLSKVISIFSSDLFIAHVSAL